jgi:iron complex transport system ATP-binding protein
MAAHDLNLVSNYADRAALLLEGKLQAVGSPRQVLTAENLDKAYRVSLSVFQHPLTGQPVILPDGD